MSALSVKSQAASVSPDVAIPDGIRALPPPNIDDASGAPSQPLEDLRFRTLLGEAAWLALHPAVRRRFSKRRGDGEGALYRGKVVATELSRGGRLVALVARLIGAPLPLVNGATGPAVVAVSEDRALGGQSWVRMYARAGKAPQVIHSAKLFRGPTGLEERVGFGIGMCLSVSEETGALAFRSTRYFIDVGRFRLWVPTVLAPGKLTVVHREEGDAIFSFRLTLEHAVLGRLIDQLALFRDVPG